MAIRIALHEGNQIEVVGDDFAEIVRVFSPSLSTEGAYLETELWLPEGSPVRFRLSLADGFALVHALGEVAWRRGAGSESPGLTIRFRQIVEGAPLIERIVDQHRIEGGRPFRLSGDASPERPATPSGDRPFSPVETVPIDELVGREILATLDQDAAPRLAPGLERTGEAEPKRALPPVVRDFLAGAEPAPKPEPVQDPPTDPLLDQSVADLRSLLGGTQARPDVLTSTVLEEPRKFSMPYAPEGAPLGLRKQPPAPRTSSHDTRESKTSSETPRRDRGASAARTHRGSDDPRAGREQDAPTREARRPPSGPREELHVDLDLLGDSGAGAHATPSTSAPPEAAPAGAPATDPMISASWLLDRWDKIAGEEAGPPSPDPTLLRTEEPPRAAAAARARRGDVPWVAILVIALALAGVYLAVQRFVLNRPRSAPVAGEPTGGAPAESLEGAAAGPEVEAVDAGRSIAEMQASRAAGDPVIEIADGALDGAPAGVLERVTWDVADRETRILVEGDGAFAPEAIRHVRLADPPREVLRVAGILRPVQPPSYRVDSRQVAAVRFGFHQQGSEREAHVVIDLAAANARLRVVRLAPQRMVLVVAGGSS